MAISAERPPEAAPQRVIRGTALDGPLFGALGTTVFPLLDSAPFRILLLTVTTLGALANLYTIRHAARLRRAAGARGELTTMTEHEWRRTATVFLLAVFTLLVVAYELYAHHFVTHHPWP